ncbi:MAG: hypothetical protein LBG57_13520, partial [Treponema sp.]|nr:hypothetical protein [Treponema sp.]
MKIFWGEASRPEGSRAAYIGRVCGEVPGQDKELRKIRQILKCCHPNVLMTLKEYLMDYAALEQSLRVVMPNLSPKTLRKLYSLYDNKICTGDEAAECRLCMEGRIRDFGFEPDMSRGGGGGAMGGDLRQNRRPASAGFTRPPGPPQ